MEHLRHDDPARIGPYVLLAALDARDGGRPSPDRRYIARRADGDGTVVLCLPRPRSDAGRWSAEAQGAHRLSSVPGFLPVHETGHDPSGGPGTRPRTPRPSPSPPRSRRTAAPSRSPSCWPWASRWPARSPPSTRSERPTRDSARPRS